MVVALESAQHALTVVLNLALALAVGAGASWLSLAGLPSTWARGQSLHLRALALAALLLALTASACRLCVESAAMAEVPLFDAWPAIGDMVGATHLGYAWKIGVAALLASMAALLCRWWRLGLAAMAVFLFSRSMVSHAAANGDATLAVLVDWVHLCVICLWVGEVLVSGLLVLGVAPRDVHGRRDCARYIDALSTSATWALVVIFATGAYSAWHNLQTPAALFGNPYGGALLVKLALVAGAALLGGANRFIVMPGLLDALRANLAGHAGRFTLVLRIESVVLLAVLVAAALLSSTSPPTAV